MAISHWEFTLKDKNTNEEKGFKDLLNIHFIELRKYKEYGVKRKNEMIDNYLWILFLNNPNDEYFKRDDILKLYEQRKKEIIDEKSKMEGKYDKGVVDGVIKEIKDDYKEVFTEEELEIINCFVGDKS
ncbi:hypothetical protein PIROE2DRAFT_64135 [Piromyces sp. E2]|nr:hypothetical protein PIROE2DRAFT_64135 [Piromyces sp. E2]|eukprot:OUM58862.1 hypothetical protein PIROE2DRAFT_64135 [Piromyces sp. E2]